MAPANKKKPENPVTDSAHYAALKGLRYVNDSKPGITRKKAGKHFTFFDVNGKKVTDENEIARIRKLAIPPAYKNVWICPKANGHLQATGIDAKGRKQYRYHPDWRSVKDGVKFNHVLSFADALPVIRAAAENHMQQRKLTREKVLATVVMLLEKTMIRVGNSEYAKKNSSYGLTTLTEDHVDVTGGTVRFDFKGKSGKVWKLKLTDRRIANIIRQCEELHGQELFCFKDDDGVLHDITSGDVNDYLKEITGADFTAKDFRTWAGTKLAAMALQEYEAYDSQAQAKKNVLAAIEHVAKMLGNTPSVCRKSYIHPEVLSAYLDGSFAKQIALEINATLKQKYDRLTDEEILVLAFLKKRLAAAA